MTLRIERVVPGGAGLARDAGKLTFVEGGITGDELDVRVTRDRNSYLEAVIERVLTPSPSRRPESEICPHAVRGECGGCNWAAVSPSSSRDLKEGLLLDALTRVGKLTPQVIPPVKFLGSPFHYRLRSRFHSDGLGRLGFLAPRSNDVFSLESCEVLSRTLFSRAAAIRERLGKHALSGGELTVLEAREGEAAVADFVLVSAPADPESLAADLRENLDGIILRTAEGPPIITSGQLSVTIRAGGAEFVVSAGSFFQANRFLLDAFLDEVRQALAEGLAGFPPREGLDLFAGAGFLTLPLLEVCKQAVAVEPAPSSNRDLVRNLAGLGRKTGSNGESVAATAEAFLARRKTPFDAVICDPPRAGLGPSVRKALLGLAPRVLVYVSCDPATLARDLEDLSRGFELRKLTLLDLFPGTHHVETIALLARRKRESRAR